MRYWQHGETGRLLRIDVQMAPSKWVEITEEEYNNAMGDCPAGTNWVLELEKEHGND